MLKKNCGKGQGAGKRKDSTLFVSGGRPQKFRQRQEYPSKRGAVGRKKKRKEETEPKSTFPKGILDFYEKEKLTKKGGQGRTSTSCLGNRSTSVEERVNGGVRSKNEAVEREAEVQKEAEGTLAM